MKARINIPENTFYETMVEFDRRGNLTSNLSCLHVYPHTYHEWECGAVNLDNDGIGGEENRQFATMIKNNSKRVVKWYQHSFMGVAVGYGAADKKILREVIARDIELGFKSDLEFLLSDISVDMITMA